MGPPEIPRNIMKELRNNKLIHGVYINLFFTMIIGLDIA